MFPAPASPGRPGPWPPVARLGHPPPGPLASARASLAALAPARLRPPSRRPEGAAVRAGGRSPLARHFAPLGPLAQGGLWPRACARLRPCARSPAGLAGGSLPGSPWPRPGSRLVPAWPSCASLARAAGSGSFPGPSLRSVRAPPARGAAPCGGVSPRPGLALLRAGLCPSLPRAAGSGSLPAFGRYAPRPPGVGSVACAPSMVARLRRATVSLGVSERGSHTPQDVGMIFTVYTVLARMVRPFLPLP